MMVGHDLLDVGVLAGLGCIVFGEATSIPFLAMPAYIHPLLLVAYGGDCDALASWPGPDAISARRSRRSGSWWPRLFLFPWLYRWRR